MLHQARLSRYIKLHYPITAMPITRFERVGDFSRGHSFRNKVDRAIVTNEKGVEKIKTRFNATPFNFDMFFVNLKNYHRFQEYGPVSRETISSLMPELRHYFKEYGWPNKDSNAITIIFVGNSAAERVPMTSWIIAHRIGHTFFARGDDANFSNDFRELYEDFSKQVFSILKQYGSIGNSRHIMQFLYQIGTFKSARDHNVRTQLEFFLDCFAQYLLTGHVKFNDPPRSFATAKAWGNESRHLYFRGPDYDYIILKHDIQYMANKLEEYFEDMLHRAVGRIFVM